MTASFSVDSAPWSYNRHAIPWILPHVLQLILPPETANIWGAYALCDWSCFHPYAYRNCLLQAQVRLISGSPLHRQIWKYLPFLPSYRIGYSPRFHISPKLYPYGGFPGIFDWSAFLSMQAPHPVPGFFEQTTVQPVSLFLFLHGCRHSPWRTLRFLQLCYTRVL